MQGKNFLDLLILRLKKRGMPLDEQLSYIKKLNDDKDANMIFKSGLSIEMGFDEILKTFEDNLMDDLEKKHVVAEIFRCTLEKINSKDDKKNINFNVLNFIIRDILNKIINLNETDLYYYPKLTYYREIGKNSFNYISSITIYKMVVDAVDDIDDMDQMAFNNLICYSIDQASKIKSFQDQKRGKSEENLKLYLINNYYDLQEEVDASNFSSRKYASLVKKVYNNPAFKEVEY